MTTNPSIWRIEGSEIVEQPTMTYQPMPSPFDDIQRNRRISYDKHIASLRRYPQNLSDSLQGKDLREGIDFRLQHQFTFSYMQGTHWNDCSSGEYLLYGEERRRVIALPISQPEQPISEEGKEFKQLLKRYVTDFALMLQDGENIRAKYETYESDNKLSIEKLILLSTPSPSQEAIEFGQWLADTNWGDTLLKKDPPIIPSMKQLYQLYTEHKNSKA